MTRQHAMLALIAAGALMLGFTQSGSRVLAQADAPPADKPAEKPVQGTAPKPSPFPKSWEFKFEHGLPSRIVVEIPGEAVPQAFWYVTYTVTNKTDREQRFTPFFEMLSSDQKVVRSDRNIPKVVFDAIRKRENKPDIESALDIGGILRKGDAEAREGVAIWPEPVARMARFTIFVGGLSGEFKIEKDAEGRTVIFRKTLQLNYIVRGDEVFPGEDEVNQNAQSWTMR